ncbi:MAG: glycoside hydrolase family 5 protein [Muribaculaceae bacterium]|nr:glycoside hydrolase family 5 protein [Muribaculaceae bacterium]
MKKTIKNLCLFCSLLLSGCLFNACSQAADAGEEVPADAFVRVKGPDLIKPDGTKLYIVGTNLGNWLNPEGYMFGFQRMTSPRLINEVFSELVGPYETAKFWKSFKDNYITEDDIHFIAASGANTIRLPFHYKLFTDEDYMGLTSNQDGFARVDSVVKWAKANDLYVILDMHDAPGGQTGDNIDDSFGYPWLLENEKAQQVFCDIWRNIADYYKNEPVILGYELINEPIATYFDNQEELNSKLQPLHKKAVAAIREVDPNHIILIGAPQWNSNFSPLTDTDYDPQLMFTCHRYGGPATAEAIEGFISFRDSSNRPMYMGEIGHNTDKWQADFVKVMKDNNIGYTFWPYKKRDNSCMMGIVMPEEWEEVVRFAEAPNHSFQEIRDAQPDRVKARVALDKFLEQCKFANCEPQVSYINSIGLKMPVEEMGNNRAEVAELIKEN